MRHPAKPSSLQQCQAKLARWRCHQTLSPSALAVDLSAAERFDFTKVIHRRLDLRPPLARQVTQSGAATAPHGHLHLPQNRFSASKNPEN
jgi:hypothetical protein